MKRTALVAALLLIPLLVIGLSAQSGCQLIHPTTQPSTQPLSVKAQVLEARRAYTATINVLATLRSAGKISDADYLRIDKVRAQTSQGIDIAGQLADAGGNAADVETQLKSVNALLDQLIAEERAVEAKR